MNTLDMKFFEEYKKAERFCCDAYSCEHGMSEYIERMEKARLNAKMDAQQWQDECKTLKHLRWLRNQIAHGESDAPVSTREDLAKLQDFHEKLLNANDPLAQLRKTKTQPKTQSGGKTAAAQAKTQPKTQPKGAPAKKQSTPAKKQSAPAKKKNSGKKKTKKKDVGRVIAIATVAAVIIVGIVLIATGILK